MKFIANYLFAVVYGSIWSTLHDHKIILPGERSLAKASIYLLEWRIKLNERIMASFDLSRIHTDMTYRKKMLMLHKTTLDHKNTVEVLKNGYNL